jgi:hypothetical protein
MSECVNWPVLLAVLGLALGLFFIVLLTGCFLMGRLDVPRRADADSSPLGQKRVASGLGQLMVWEISV